MLPQETSVIDVAEEYPLTLCLCLDKVKRVPYSVHDCNLRSVSIKDDGRVLVCEGVVMREPVEVGQNLVLVEAIAPIIGFYNASPGVTCAAYGKPAPHRWYDVVVVATFKPHKTSNSTFYEAINFQVIAQHQEELN